jgi:hypothetical protein
VGWVSPGSSMACTARCPPARPPACASKGPARPISRAQELAAQLSSSFEAADALHQPPTLSDRGGDGGAPERQPPPPPPQPLFDAIADGRVPNAAGGSSEATEAQVLLPSALYGCGWRSWGRDNMKT